ncbi:NPXTG-anchored protein [Ruminococcus sp.]|uniref:NPXTG-anchored protein n=1 Tax=Ruminococcus sp. TaxID=41978 RepID=UPI0025F70E25|nr:NPXTG-anchored protein [Ruminococcus sp.]MBQ9541474.1 NPXTG-anchored protein [Ruminococcus sp.]
MKAKRIFAGLSAAVIAATMMAVSASATKLSDVVYPSKTETDKNDGWYSVGAMGFYMSQKWKWNQSDWFGINDEGKIELSYKISEVLTDTTMEGKGTLGDMGVMILNLPEDSYPYDVTISDAKFVTNDGEEIILDTVNSITEATLDKEGGFRIHIRPVDEVDKDSGEVTVPASPEVAGWDQEGAFKGGTLSMTIDFGAPAAKEESKADDSKTESKADDSKTDSKASNTTTTGKTTTTTTTTASASSAASDTTENKNSNTGAAAGTIFGLLALAGAGAVVSRKKK